MQLVNTQLLYDLAHGCNEIRSLIRLYYTVYDSLKVCRLVIVIRLFMQQFLNNVCKLPWQGLAYPAACVFAADTAQDKYEAL